ncbi:MAG: ABC transporter permease, partial [Christensenellaceae bacterium]
MKGLITIVRKELARFFKDKKLWVTMILPGVLIYFIYSILGTVLMDTMIPTEGQEYEVLTVNMSRRMENITVGVLQESGYTITYIEQGELSDEEAQALVKDGEKQAIIRFPENFDELVKENPKQPLPVEIWYNSTDTDSSMCYEILTSVLDVYRTNLSNPFVVNPGDGYDLAGEEGLAAMIYSTIVPYLLIIFIFSGVMSITPESVAGEKERGTIATILVTPVSRSALAFGKILALSVFSMIGGLSSFLGTMLSIPNLLGGVGMGTGNLFELYPFGNLVSLFFLIMTFVPLVVGIMSVPSVLAKSVKEASSWASMLMILSMVVGILTMVGLSPSLWMAFVPILNVAIGISSLLALTA